MYLNHAHKIFFYVYRYHLGQLLSCVYMNNCNEQHKKRTFVVSVLVLPRNVVLPHILGRH